MSIAQHPPLPRDSQPIVTAQAAEAIVKQYVAKKEHADRVDNDVPLFRLEAKMKAETGTKQGSKSVNEAKTVIYWMRNKDIRVQDNRALAAASSLAKSTGRHLIAVWLISPQDLVAHQRSSRRVDFMLRNASVVKKELDALDIPFYVETIDKRADLPKRLVEFAKSVSASDIFGNLEYELDELRRDEKVLELAKAQGITCSYKHDYLILPPGQIKAKSSGKLPTIYAAFRRQWLVNLKANMSLLKEEPMPEANKKDIRQQFPKLFESKIPDQVDDFECEGKEAIHSIWVPGHDAAVEIMQKFITKTADPDMIYKSPLDDGGKESKDHNRLEEYNEKRSVVTADTTSRISPYLASGVISVREVVRMVRGEKELTDQSSSGLGSWMREIIFREFASCIVAEYPRVCMGRPFVEKFKDVVWETDEKALMRWQYGLTGIPLVDAGMRQMRQMGWMHNRVRMLTASYLVKDLMIDWRLGEVVFHKSLLDADLASNNWGWQNITGCGADAQPYFRILNAAIQGPKFDPTGNYIKTWVPELRHLSGKELYEPYKHLSKAAFEKLDYPEPMIGHEEARKRALERYKNPGAVEDDEHDEARFRDDDDKGDVEEAASNKRKGGPTKEENIKTKTPSKSSSTPKKRGTKITKSDADAQPSVTKAFRQEEVDLS